jgi:hypothetical protein
MPGLFVAWPPSAVGTVSTIPSHSVAADARAYLATTRTISRHLFE